MTVEIRLKAELGLEERPGPEDSTVLGAKIFIKSFDILTDLHMIMIQEKHFAHLYNFNKEVLIHLFKPGKSLKHSYKVIQQHRIYSQRFHQQFPK